MSISEKLVTDEMIEAAWLAHRASLGMYVPRKAPAERNDCRELYTNIYLAMEASRPVDGDMVERVAKALWELEYSGEGRWPTNVENPQDWYDQARVAIEAAGIASLLQQKEEAERDLLNLLATIHRDGGQYAAEHGREKAVEDAIVLSAERIGALENLFEACRIHDPDDWTGEPAMIEAALILKNPPFDKEPKQ